jgi:fucose permease
VPLICYLYILYFALAGYKPATVANLQPATMEAHSR